MSPEPEKKSEGQEEDVKSEQSGDQDPLEGHTFGQELTELRSAARDFVDEGLREGLSEIPDPIRLELTNLLGESEEAIQSTIEEILALTGKLEGALQKAIEEATERAKAKEIEILNSTLKEGNLEDLFRGTLEESQITRMATRLALDLAPDSLVSITFLAEDPEEPATSHFKRAQTWYRPDSFKSRSRFEKEIFKAFDGAMDVALRNYAMPGEVEAVDILSSFLPQDDFMAKQLEGLKIYISPIRYGEQRLGYTFLLYDSSNQSEGEEAKNFKGPIELVSRATSEALIRAREFKEQ